METQVSAQGKPSAHRVTVSLSPSQHTALTKLSRHTGEPISKIIRAMVDESQPALLQLVSTLERSRGLSDAMKRSAALRLEKVHHDLQGAALDAQDTLSDAQMDIEDAIQQSKARA